MARKEKRQGKHSRRKEPRRKKRRGEQEVVEGATADSAGRKVSPPPGEPPRPVVDEGPRGERPVARPDAEQPARETARPTPPPAPQNAKKVTGTNANLPEEGEKREVGEQQQDEGQAAGYPRQYWVPVWYPPVYPPYGYPPQPYFHQQSPGEAGRPQPPETGTYPMPAPMVAQPGQFAPPVGLPPGEIPVEAPPFPPGEFGYPLPPYPPMEQQLPPLEALEMEQLTYAEKSHWRGDFKWMFGIMVVIMLFSTLALAGLYRISGRGSAQDIGVPIIEKTTEIEDAIEENYDELNSKARRGRNAEIVIPDVGVSVSLDAETVTSLGEKELTDQVIAEIQKEIYEGGYEGDLPFRLARGVGEERARGVCVTFIGYLTRSTHAGLIWPVVIFAGITLALAVPFLIFCRGWGKMTGAGVAIIAASLPFTLFVRLAGQFIWKGASAGPYKGAMYQAYRSAGSMMLAYYDIALGVGALLLLTGIVFNLLGRKSKSRVVPFADLAEPEEYVIGGPSIDTVPPPAQPPLPDEPEPELDEGAFSEE
jgi:hypothetical protein